MYHHVGPHIPGAMRWLTVTPRAFRRHMGWIREAGFTPIRSAEWLAYLRTRAPLPRRPVLITFDDAFEDLATHAFPLLAASGIPATVFVPTGHVASWNRWDALPPGSRHRVLTRAHLVEWAGRGLELGAHSRSHADLSCLPEEELDGEVSGCRDDLYGLSADPIVSFAYPFGRSNPAVRRAVQSRFDLAFGTAEGVNWSDTDPLDLRRTMPLDGDSAWGFKCRLRHGYNPFLRARARVGKWVRDGLRR